MKSETRSPLAALKASPAISAAVVLLIACLVAIPACYLVVQQDAANDQRYLQQVAELRAEAYRLTALSRDATSGDEQAFAQLEGVVRTMSSTWDSLRLSDPRTQRELLSEFTTFEGIWSRVKNNAQVIASNQDLIVTLNNVGRELNNNLPALQAQHNNIVEILLENEAPADQVSQAQMQSWRAERIGRNVDKMLRGDTDASTAADQFNLDANIYGRVLVAMQEGDATMRIPRVADANARASLQQIAALFEAVNESVQEMFEGSSTLFRARQASDAMLEDSPQLLQAL